MGLGQFISNLCDSSDIRDAKKIITNRDYRHKDWVLTAVINDDIPWISAVWRYAEHGCSRMQQEDYNVLINRESDLNKGDPIILKMYSDIRSHIEKIKEQERIRQQRAKEIEQQKSAKKEMEQQKSAKKEKHDNLVFLIIFCLVIWSISAVIIFVISKFIILTGIVKILAICAIIFSPLVVLLLLGLIFNK